MKDSGERMRFDRAAWAVLPVCAACSIASAQTVERVWTDRAGDAEQRLTDFGADGVLNPDAGTPDLREVRLSAWSAPDPINDPFTGTAVDAAGAHLLRMDIVFDGLVNPPGPLGFAGQPYDPFQFGPNPAFGFIDLDVDADVDTGGQVGGAATQRYLANVGRFGRVPRGTIAQRAASFGHDFDGDFFSPPFFERSGEDFTVALCGCWRVDIIQEDGDLDQQFDAGETWIVRGRFFERAQGYRDASGVFGGSDFGFYDPRIDVRYSHDPATDTTTIRIIFPLDMPGAALLTGEPEQIMDFDVSNHVSVVEALNDIVVGAQLGLFGPVQILAGAWATLDPFDFLDPTSWTVTALVGTAYAVQEQSLYVWTDTGFDDLPGDFNADGLASLADRDLFDSILALMDGGPFDGDGVVDGSFVISTFADDFAVFDLSNDGVVDDADRDLIINPADLDGDGDVDVFDFFVFTSAFSSGDPAADINGDGQVDLADLFAFILEFFHSTG